MSKLSESELCDRVRILLSAAGFSVGQIDEVMEALIDCCNENRPKTEIRKIIEVN